ncbi:MAG: hypothetical protein ACK4Q5_13765 [Saprospiraceae bacterium]
MPKSYSQFKYDDILALNLALMRGAYFKNILPLEASDFLKTTLQINSRMVLTSEKAKSEFIIAPVLYEIARRNEDKISFFSGQNLDVDPALGLRGFCDFIFSKVPASPIVNAPVFCVTEAKNDNLERGTPQCIAEMFASRLFNQKHKKNIDVIYGCVTTGYQWQFLKLERQTVFQDSTIYSLSDLPQVLGILQFIVEH